MYVVEKNFIKVSQMMTALSHAVFVIYGHIDLFSRANVNIYADHPAKYFSTHETNLHCIVQSMLFDQRPTTINGFGAPELHIPYADNLTRISIPSHH